MRNEVKVGMLPNGLRFYSQYDWSGGTNLAGIGIKAGAIHAPPGCVGLPHLVEHLLARESLKYPPDEVDFIFEKFLGDPDDDINIRIDRISTNFGFGDLLRRKDMLICLDVMAHFLRDKIVTTEGIDVEKAAVHNECYLRGRDVMPVLLDDLFHEIAYKKNPARLRIDGEKKDLKNIKQSQIKSFIDKHYTTGNMFLIVLGPKFEEVKELAKQYFGDCKEKSSPTLDYDNSEDLPSLSLPRIAELARDTGQYHFAIGFYTRNYLSDDTEAIDILARILAMRLRHILRDCNRKFGGGVYRANAHTSRSFIHGLIYVTFATVNSEFAKEAREVVIQEFKKLKEKLVDERELEAMVYRMNTTHMETFKKVPLSLAEMIIEAVCNGDEDLARLHSYRQRLHKVNRKKLLCVANKYFSPNYIQAMVRPAV